MDHVTLLLALVAAHALCDYPLQGDFIAKAKNFRAPIAGVPWYQAMAAHALIQAAAVTIITGSLFLGSLEFVLHFAIDSAKIADDSPTHKAYNIDQALHVVCKVFWVVLLPHVP